MRAPGGAERPFAGFSPSVNPLLLSAVPRFQAEIPGLSSAQTGTVGSECGILLFRFFLIQVH